MNILFLAPRLPLPADTGGKIRTYNIIKQIAKKHLVHLVCFSFEMMDQESVKEFARMNVAVTLIPVREDNFTEKAIGLLLGQFPYSIMKYYSKNMENALIALKRSNPFDLIHVDHLHMAHYRHFFAGTPAVLDEHNVEYRILERCVPVERSLIKKWIFRNQAVKMKTFESRAVKEFSGCLAVSEDDADILKEIGGSNAFVQVIPNGVDTEYFNSVGQLPVNQLASWPVGQLPVDPMNKPTDQQDIGLTGKLANRQTGKLTESSLVFTGSMDWLPNDDAVLFFSKEILPLIWEKDPNVKFYIVGKSPSQAIQTLAGQEPRIVVTGRVDDVRPYIAQAKAFVVPIRIGGGTRLKILEAMSMEKPVVSTTIGAEGIKHTDGKDILLADQPQDFADKVVSLLNDDYRAERMGVLARKLVCDQYDWNIIGQKIYSLYEEVVHVRKN